MTKNTLDAERAVVGSILIDSACLPELRKRLSERDFASDLNATIFRAACALADEGKPPDPMLIQAALKADGKGDTGEYLVSLMCKTPTARNAILYADLLRTASMGREIKNIAADAIERIEQGEDARTICTELHTATTEISDRVVSSGTISITDTLKDFYQYRMNLDKGMYSAAVKTRYEGLDRLLGGGMLAEGLYILAARPSVGKTTLAINFVDSICEKKEAALFVSLEMSRRQLITKHLALKCGIQANRLMTDRLTTDEYKKVAEASAALSLLPITYNRAAGASLPDIEFLARATPDLRLLVIDYLGLIKQAEGRSLYDKVTLTSQNLKRLARTLEIPILCLAQLNRGVEGQNRMPRLSDLRDSGAIEQDADGVMLLHCPGETGRPTSPDGVAPAELKLILAKNRHGETGTVNLNFYLRNGRIAQQ